MEGSDGTVIMTRWQTTAWTQLYEDLGTREALGSTKAGRGTSAWGMRGAGCCEFPVEQPETFHTKSKIAFCKERSRGKHGTTKTQ